MDTQPELGMRGEPSAKAEGASADALLDERSLARLRWRCRRGMLENDLILARFLDARGATLTYADLAVLNALLDHSDNDLWDLLSGCLDPVDPALASLLCRLRSI